MSFIRIISVLAVLCIAALPAMGELTDYQKGAQDGLAAGIRMGWLLGALPYNSTAAQQYNSMVDPFNARLQLIFGANQTAINLFWMRAIAGQTTVGGYQPYPIISTRPVHEMDASWNQTATYHPDAKNKIYGYDPDTYYTMVGWKFAPNTPTGYGDNLLPP